MEDQTSDPTPDQTSDQSSDSAVSAPPRWKALDPVQRRVLGVLIEKAKTTPGSYPLTVNAIVVGSNQKNNREPLTSYEAFDVEKALSELQELGAVKEIDWVGRVPKYKHLAYEWLGVRPVELAVLGELLLRGAQALGDLRARAARMEPIADLAALKPIVDGLVERDLMLEITPPGRGQIVSHNLYPPEELEEVRSHHGRASAAGDFGGGRAESASPRRGGSTDELRAEISELRTRVEDLTERVARLEDRSGGGNGDVQGSSGDTGHGL